MRCVGAGRALSARQGTVYLIHNKQAEDASNIDLLSVCCCVSRSRSTPRGSRALICSPLCGARFSSSVSVVVVVVVVSSLRCRSCNFCIPSSVETLQFFVCSVFISDLFRVNLFSMILIKKKYIYIFFIYMYIYTHTYTHIYI